ncbi:MAG: hypothetical protein LBL66_07535 [Clostridiales bacterium]|nr:hypothetical protein [Clostridiales bacterium]
MKKWMCIVTAALLALGLCAGCGGKNELSDELGVYTLDADGVKVYTIVGYANGPILPENPKCRAEVEAAVNAKLYADLGFKVNVQVTNVTANIYGNKLAGDLSNGDTIDMSRMVNRSALPEYYADEMALDVTAYVNAAPKLKAAIPQEAWDEYTIDGKILAIPFVGCPADSAMYARGDLLEAAGYTNPDGSYKIPAEKAEFVDMLRAVKAYQTGQAGQRVPAAISFDTLEKLFYGLYTDKPGHFADGQTIKHKIYDDTYLTFLKDVRTWSKENLVDKLYNFNDATAANMLTNETAAVIGGNVFAVEYGSLNAMSKTPAYKLDCIPIFFDEYAALNRKMPTASLSNTYVWFPYTAQSIGAAVKYLEWALCTSQENYDLATYGIKDKTYTLDEGGAVSIAAAETGANNFSDLFGAFYVSNNAAFERPNAVRPQLANEIYDLYYSQPIGMYYISPINFINSKLPLNLSTAATDANNIVASYVQKIVDSTASGFYADGEVDAKYAEMKTQFEAKNGHKVFEEYSARYKASSAG